MKIGILGTGNIVRSITATLKKMSDMECYAIASRTVGLGVSTGEIVQVRSEIKQEK